jgi:hypothetical protein
MGKRPYKKQLLLLWGKQLFLFLGIDIAYPLNSIPVSTAI